MSTLDKHLEEERQKCEDLQFRIDEATICGGNETVNHFFFLFSMKLTQKNCIYFEKIHPVFISFEEKKTFSIVQSKLREKNWLIVYLFPSLRPIRINFNRRTCTCTYAFLSIFSVSSLKKMHFNLHSRKFKIKQNPIM